MSSQDKTGPQDGNEDAAPRDHAQDGAQDTATELPEHGADTPESPENGPDTPQNPEDDGVEDAEFVDAAAAGDDADTPATPGADDAGDSPRAWDTGLTETPADGADQPADVDSDHAAATDTDADADTDPDMATDDTDADADTADLTRAAATAAVAGTAAAGTAAAAPATASGEDADPTPPAAPPTAPPAQATSQKSGGGFMPALLGGVIAAGIGFGTAVYVGGDLTGGDDALEQALAAQGDRLTALDTRLGALAEAMPAQSDGEIAALGDRLGDQLGALAGQIDTIAGAVDTVQSGVASLENRLDGLETGLTDVTERLGAVERRPLTESSEAAQAAFSAYESDLEDLRAALEEQTAINADLVAQLEDRTAAAEAEIEAAAARARELQAQAEEQARVAAAQAEEQARIATEQAEAQAAVAALREALASLDSSLEKGAPFAEPLAALAEKGGDVPPALTEAATDGVASLPDLRAAFPDLARDALDASIRETVADDMTGRAYAFLRAQTGLRSLEPRDGDDPDAVLSRAEAALGAGDLATALSELEQLPPAGQDVMSDWMARAEQRRAVIEAAGTLADTLLAN